MDHLAPTTLSQFIRLDACLRFLHFKLHPEIVGELRARYGVHARPLSQRLKQAGQRFEDEVIATLHEKHAVRDLAEFDSAGTLAALHDVAREPTILYQAALDGAVGGWQAAGRADLIEAVRDSKGRLHILIADIKASREERLEHRVQVAAYALLLEDACRRAGLPLARIVGAVVHRTADAFQTLHDPALHFDLEPYRDLVQSLATGDHAPLRRAAEAMLDDLPFAFNARCDGCPFDTICLPHAAERADIALIPDLNRAARHALRMHNIRNLHEFAALKAPDERGKLQPVAEHAERLALLLHDPVLAPQLDHLLARAHAVLRRLDPARTTTPRLPDQPFAPLPDRAQRPRLLQLFLDLQADDATGLVYLAAARLHGPAAERSITLMLDAPPTAERERALLHDFAAALEAAIRELAQDDAPPLHVVVYDRRAQRIALEACARHEHAHLLLGVLVTWLQEQPQIERATCATLREIIGQQRNLKLTCDSLYAVASEVWAEQRWDWRTPLHDFPRRFRAGIFDREQRFVRDGDAFRAAGPADSAAIRVEVASRFSSQIPTEYAYAIWQNDPQFPTRDELIAFAEHRMAALAHLEKACSHRDRKLDVPLLPLAQLSSAAGPRDLKNALITFMELEHAAMLADLLAHCRQPIARRVLTGRTALLEAIAVGDAKEQPQTARFRFAPIAGGGWVQPRFKVGDFAVLNEADDARSAWEIIRGRIVIISAIDDATVEIELTSLSAAGAFKFTHDSKLQVQLRCRYTLDEMADDLLGDKTRAALDHLDANPLARWLHALTPNPSPKLGEGSRRRGEGSLATAGGTSQATGGTFATAGASLATAGGTSQAIGGTSQAIGGTSQAAGASLPAGGGTSQAIGASLPAAADSIVAAIGAAQPTAAQGRVIAEGADDPLRLVQGPPGSGKSRTLGLAVVARLLHATQAQRPMRVAVTAKTHSAVQVALDSIAQAWGMWARHTDRVPPLLADVTIVKLGGSATAGRGAGVRWADPRRAVKELRALIGGACVIGGTPGGLSTLLDTTQRKTRWDGLFDLLLIDEASQMSLPEGVLAASTLHANGQMIVVGDHRQMPPIIAHTWDAAAGSLQAWQPQRSLFKWLLDANAPVVALDESFRLHRDHAAFLQAAIYRHDGIMFHSRRTHLLPPHDFGDPFANAALRHDVPLVVIEHGERGSRQQNEFEAALVADLVQQCLGLGLDGRDGIGVVVPHRAQKAALRARLPELGDADSIDTVERFQGGERDVIIVACTASDPEYVMAEAEFLMDPQRLNVALSRARKKLIVVASTSVFGALPIDLPIFERAALWKRLRSYAAPFPLWSGALHGYFVQVMGPDTDA